VTVRGTDARKEVTMARAAQMIETRLARWVKAFRERRYYDSIE
jgi:hypothetical protein